jgi:hypothetical protein
MKTDFLLNRHFDTLIYGNLDFIIEYSTGIIKPKTISILSLQAVVFFTFFYFLYFPTKIRYTGNHLENEISAACGSSDREVLPICSVYGEKYGKIIIY